MMQIRLKSDHSQVREVEGHSPYGYYLAQYGAQHYETRYYDGYWEPVPKWKPAEIRAYDASRFSFRNIVYTIPPGARIRTIGNGRIELEEEV